MQRAIVSIREASCNGRRVRSAFEIGLQPLDEGATLVTIAEAGRREGEAGLRKSYLNCEGWSQMLCCMKAYLEHGINLRQGYSRSELQGQPALDPQV